jgi:hypothetical protein
VSASSRFDNDLFGLRLDKRLWGFKNGGARVKTGFAGWEGGAGWEGIGGWAKWGEVRWGMSK